MFSHRSPSGQNDEMVFTADDGSYIIAAAPIGMLLSVGDAITVKEHRLCHEALSALSVYVHIGERGSEGPGVFKGLTAKAWSDVAQGRDKACMRERGRADKLEKELAALKSAQAEAQEKNDVVPAVLREIVEKCASEAARRLIILPIVRKTRAAELLRILPKVVRRVDFLEGIRGAYRDSKIIQLYLRDVGQFLSDAAQD